MYDFSSPDFWIVAAGGLATGAFLGWLLTSIAHRRSGGGKNVHQLRKEMDDYREEVNEHFAKTAELFKDTTEKYRDLYEHLAGGAEGLCDDLPGRTQVEFRPGKLLAENSNGSDGDIVSDQPLSTEENGTQPPQPDESKVRPGL